MGDADRKHLYISLLRGIANEAQDRMCAANKQHSWGRWERYVVKKDTPIGPASDDATTENETYWTASRRACLNCGKQETHNGR